MTDAVTDAMTDAVIGADEALWEDPDRAVQVEDDSPESLAGDAVDSEADDLQCFRPSAEAEAAGLPGEVT